MIDIKLIRENKDLVKENIRKKFQDQKLPLVDEIEALDIEYRDCKKKGDDLRALKNSKSAEIGALMREGKKEEANLVKEEVSKYGDEITELGKKEEACTAFKSLATEFPKAEEAVRQKATDFAKALECN